MNHSIYSADRATHLKIVVVALACATVVAGVAIGARLTSPTTAASMARVPGGMPLVKASREIAVTVRSGAPTIR
jgi:hypothetical protein